MQILAIYEVIYFNSYIITIHLYIHQSAACDADFIGAELQPQDQITVDIEPLPNDDPNDEAASG